MRNRIFIFLLGMFCSAILNAQEFEWFVENTSSNSGERIVAILDAPPSGYVGLQLIGQVIDNNGNWGYNLPTVANFKLFVKYTGGFGYDLVQDVKTSKIKLGLRKVSDSKVHLVANCPFNHMAMRILFKKIEGSVGVTMGNPNVVTTEGESLMAEPRYISTSHLNINSQTSGDAIVTIESDTDNNNERDNPILQLRQDGGTLGVNIGFNEIEFGSNIFGIGRMYSNIKYNDSFLIDTKNGNISIGKRPTDDHKLDVAGTIRAEEILVEAKRNTADFVFEEDYNLRDLSEVESFIKANKHLPEIPSAAQMEEQGVNLAEMNKLLLQKVEELTLYTIGLEQKDREKEKELDAMKAEMALIKALLLGKVSE